MRGWQPICVVLQEREKKFLSVIDRKGGRVANQLAIFFIIEKESPGPLHPSTPLSKGGGGGSPFVSSSKRAKKDLSVIERKGGESC